MNHLSMLKDRLFGLDAQKKQLEKILNEFYSTSKGASCILSGRRGTGKSALLDSLLPNYFSEDEIIYEDGDLCKNVNQPLKKLSLLGLVDESSSIENNRIADKKNCRMVIVIDHFEYFTSKKSQNFLYTLLNGTHRFPWLVILIGSSQDCVSVPPLEKRIYSRVSKSIISFNANFREADMFSAFSSFLDCFANEKSLDFDELLKAQSRPILSRFFRRCGGIDNLKRLVAMMALTWPMRRRLGELAIETFEWCADSICPNNEAAEILNELSLRQLCLLNCFVRLHKNEHRYEMLCREVKDEYRRFINVYKVHSLFAQDEALYKDIEELIAVAAITFRGSNDIGELQFKKLSLNMEEETLMSCLKSRHLSAELKQWLHIS